MSIELIMNAAIIILIPVGRSVAGWAVHALEDEKVSSFEWKQLLQTTIRVGSMGAMGYFGFAIMGVENAALAAGVSSFFADKIFNIAKKFIAALKKPKK